MGTSRQAIESEVAEIVRLRGLEIGARNLTISGTVKVLSAARLTISPASSHPTLHLHRP